MADKPEKPKKDAPQLTVTDTGDAPFIFFEGAPNFGFANGIVNVTLGAARHLVKNGESVTDAVAMAHLRCSIPAAVELRAALDSALLLAAKAGGAAH
jgi:hypothetical protein